MQWNANWKGQNPTMTDETHPKPNTRQRIWSIVGYPVLPAIEII
jgi:hypothetical protein